MKYSDNTKSLFYPNQGAEAGRLSGEVGAIYMSRTSSTVSTDTDSSESSSQYPSSTTKLRNPAQRQPSQQLARPQAVFRGIERLPFKYPDGFHCPKCRNTGVKIKTGKSCRSCYAKFATQRPEVQIYNPPLQSSDNTKTRSVTKFLTPTPRSGPMLVGYADSTPVVVVPGDPSIGGVECGRCRGTGVTKGDVLFQETCKTCRGLGRLI